MKRLGSYADLISVLKPEHFDNTIEAVKSVSRFDVSTRNFGAASLALHFRTTLINLCDLASKLILRRKIPHFSHDIDKMLTHLERFKNLVDTQWATEIGSLALKDLNEKSATKPKLLPVTEDIIKLVKLVENKSEEAYKILTVTKDSNAYRILSETVLVATILHNRKRVGDVQYLEWKSFREQFESNNTVLQTEIANSLTENERILTQNYRRIVSIGKGSRPVTILIPKKILPQDVYQIAKVSKILLLMEKGNAAKYKNKTLEEIDIDMDEIESLSNENDNSKNLQQNNNNGQEEMTESPKIEGRFEMLQEESHNNISTFNKLDISSVGCPQKKVSRQQWTTNQKTMMKQYFKYQIRAKKAPRKNECETFVNIYENDFRGVSWTKVKTFVYNEYRLHSE
ncbi:hypothetical protein NQ314_014115 [Rhamnusium bicolor]|uniref:Uncharacterized protein n=1 Tax=Rhamnusium bicolor TaxID=1586634 RepID=A0AAV8X432_9CUCU|nr:hypothetical protein NQ314_014115 [Rhamnusium bicolor]